MSGEGLAVGLRPRWARGFVEALTAQADSVGRACPLSPLSVLPVLQASEPLGVRSLH